MKEELAGIESKGATARAAGAGYFDNPFLKTENCPASTGEAVDVWSAKHDAWERGWRIEDAIKGS